MLCYNLIIYQNILLSLSIPAVSDSQSLLKINVGFIVHQSIGYYRDFDFDIPSISLEPDFVLNKLGGSIRITRTPQGLLLEAKMKAATPAECVRCLETFSQSLDVEFSELYAFDRRSVTESGLILPENGYINLAPVLREFMLLDIPIQALCKEDCKGLCLECGTNLNLSTCEHSTAQNDNFFDTLQKQP